MANGFPELTKEKAAQWLISLYNSEFQNELIQCDDGGYISIKAICFTAIRELGYENILDNETKRS